jgi:hypothetical protein
MRWPGAGGWLTMETDPLVTGPGVRIVPKENAMAGKTAPSDGTYTDGRGRFRVRKGQPIPEGAAFTAAGDEGKPEKRAKKAPAENRAKQAAPENRAKDA